MSERIDDLMERMERLVTEGPMWRWHCLRRPDGAARIAMWRESGWVANTPYHPTLRAALEDALTQAEKAVADAH